MLISLQAMIVLPSQAAAVVRSVLCAVGLCGLAVAAPAQEGQTPDSVDPVVTADPVKPGPAAVPDLVLPEVCAGSGLSAQACLDILAQMQLERYCRIKDVAAADCAAAISAYALPLDCQNADLTAPGCLDFLDSRTRLYREQVKGLIAQCKGEDLSVCQAFQDENGTLTARLTELEADLATLRGQNATLKDETTELAATAETLRKALAQAEEAVARAQVDVADVCRAAALRLNARAEAALGPGAPVLDEAACAQNPIAEITRFLGAHDLPKDEAKAGDVPADPAPDPTLAPTSAPSPDPSPDPAPELDPEPASAPEPAPEPTEQACVALPTEDDLVVYFVTDPGVLSGLAPVRFNRLVRELTQGTTAQAAVDVVWPSSSGPEERDLAVSQICSNFPVTCPEQSGVTICP